MDESSPREHDRGSDAVQEDRDDDRCDDAGAEAMEESAQIGNFAPHARPEVSDLAPDVSKIAIDAIEALIHAAREVVQSLVGPGLPLHAASLEMQTEHLNTPL
jgi:hypothetical protein